MSFSKILSRFDKRDTGRLFVKSNLESFFIDRDNFSSFKESWESAFCKRKVK